MLLIIFYFITFFAGVICLSSILFRIKREDFILINKFLIGLYTISTLRFLTQALANLYPNFEKYHIHLFISMLWLIITTPCIYLYFNDIIFEKKLNKKIYLHLTIPSISIIFYIFCTLANHKPWIKYIFWVCIVYSLCYIIAIFFLLYKQVWNRKSDIESVYSQNQVIRNWSLFLYACIVIGVVGRTLGLFFLHPTQDSLDHFQNLTWFSAMFWLVIFSIVLVKPEILYGYHYVQKMTESVKEKSFFSMKIWQENNSNKDILSQKDQLLAEKIKSSIPSYISNLENISLHTDFFRNPECSINDLAAKLNVPVSHLSYVLKYHCNVSFVDYKKIVRINDAVNQIKEGYLKTNTIESLAKLVGFISYSTFSIAFKEITNSTAQDYA